MIGGKRPTPTNLKKLLGNPGKRRLPTREAFVPRSLPAPPAHLSPEAIEEWQRVSAELFNVGLLSVIDRSALAAYCQVYGRWVQAERGLAALAKLDPVYAGLLHVAGNGALTQHPLVGTANKAAADMVRYAGEFGMTPSARSRITAAPPEGEKDPAAEFFN